MNPQQEQLLGWLKPSETQRGRTRTVIATATSDSDKGMVYVEMDAQVLSGGDGYASRTTITKLSTTEYVEAGDKVIVSIFDVGGIGKPIVTGVYGGGDKMNERIAALEG